MLEVLNIGDCLVKSKGALAVAENIKGLTKLKVPIFCSGLNVVCTERAATQTHDKI